YWCQRWYIEVPAQRRYLAIRVSYHGIKLNVTTEGDIGATDIKAISLGSASTQRNAGSEVGYFCYVFHLPSLRLFLVMVILRFNCGAVSAFLQLAFSRSF